MHPSVRGPWDAARAAETRAVIERIIVEAEHPLLRSSRFPSFQVDMRSLYEPLSYGPVWFDGSRLRPAAADVIGVLRAADTFGLPAEGDDVALLARWFEEEGNEPGLGPREAGLFDVALSLLYMRLLTDVHEGRIDPKALSIDYDREPGSLHLSDLVRTASIEDRVQETVAGVEPRFQQYRRLKAALPRYRKLSIDQGLPAVPPQRKVSPGDSYDGASALADLLVALGDLPVPGTLATLPRGESGLYDGDLVLGVKRFQARHGLTADGTLGALTFSRLNVPAERRVRQIELALERFRWLPDVDGPVIAINIPSFRLWCFDLPAPGGKPTLAMKVVVGNALKTQTPVFAEPMRYVVFRPYWNIPYSIAAKEILPANAKEPGYLDRNDMEVVSGQGDEASPVAPTPEALAQVRAGAWRMRQRPGPRNALGPVAFMFPNAANVYLHGTPAPVLFARDRRDLSHGCIRASDPAGLAEWVLRGVAGWDRAQIEEAMAAGGPPLRVNLPRPIPVLIFYTTAVSDAEGRIAFFEDIYHHDQRLEAALRALEAGAP